MTEAERELAQLNSYKTAQAWISSTALLGMCKLWRSFGRTPNCCQIWLSFHHPSLPHKQLQDSPPCLIWPCLWNKMSPLQEGLSFCTQWLKLKLCLPLQWGQVWALKQWVMREWTGWSKRNMLGPWYGQGWRPRTSKHLSVSLVNYTYSRFRALISKEYRASGIFVKRGNLLNFSVYII